MYMYKANQTNFNDCLIFLTIMEFCSFVGYEAIVVENVHEGDELRTDVEAIERELKERSVENILCVFTTTSCFAPRAADR